MNASEDRIIKAFNGVKRDIEDIRKRVISHSEYSNIMNKLNQIDKKFDEKVKFFEKNYDKLLNASKEKLAFVKKEFATKNSLKDLQEEIKHDIKYIENTIKNKESNFNDKISDVRNDIKLAENKNNETIKDAEDSIKEDISDFKEIVKNTKKELKTLFVEQEKYNKEYLENQNKDLNKKFTDYQKNTYSKSEQDDIFLTINDFKKKFPEKKYAKELEKEVNKALRNFEDKSTLLREELDHLTKQINVLKDDLKDKISSTEFEKIQDKKSDVEDIARIDRDIETVSEKSREILKALSDVELMRNEIEKLRNSVSSYVTEKDVSKQITKVEKGISHLDKEFEHLSKQVNKKVGKSKDKFVEEDKFKDLKRDSDYYFDRIESMEKQMKKLTEELAKTKDSFVTEKKVYKEIDNLHNKMNVIKEELDQK